MCSDARWWGIETRAARSVNSTREICSAKMASVLADWFHLNFERNGGKSLGGFWGGEEKRLVECVMLSFPLDIHPHAFREPLLRPTQKPPNTNLH